MIRPLHALKLKLALLLPLIWAGALPVPAAGAAPLEGIKNPSLAINATGFAFSKGGASSAAPFIDRMKGALAWVAKTPVGSRNSPNFIQFDDPVFLGAKANNRPIKFVPSTTIDLFRVPLNAAYQKKIITPQQYQQISRSPFSYFKIAKTTGGVSGLFGRLRPTDQFTLMARFDRDIGLSLKQLRKNGQAILTPGDRVGSADTLTLDRNGWPTAMPTSSDGTTGTYSTQLMAYPRKSASAPNSIYAGRFYLLADGEGTIRLQQTGKGQRLVRMPKVKINGPTRVPFDFQPNGNYLQLTVVSSDPRGNGEYLRDIRIVHADHWELYEAGEIFTPEFIGLLKDFRVVRWMPAMEGSHVIPHYGGEFAARQLLSHYTFNLGRSGTARNGMPIDAVIAFSNKTGTDPWISLPVNISDKFAREMARYIAANLDPSLRLYVEFANEIWNGIFPSHKYAGRQAERRWGRLTVAAGRGQQTRLGKRGRFFAPNQARKLGFNNLGDLGKQLGLRRPLLPDGRRWIEWTAMRGTQVGRIFEQEFEKLDRANADARLNNVLGVFTYWPRSTKLLLDAQVWREEEPGAWIDPRSVFDSVAVGAYFGHDAGSRNSDLIRHWLTNEGAGAAAAKAISQFTAGLNPGEKLITLKPALRRNDGRIAAGSVIRNVKFSKALVIDAYPFIEAWNRPIVQRMRRGEGLKNGKALLTGAEVHQYVRLVDEGGRTALQIRANPASDRFQTALTFDRRIPAGIDSLVSGGQLRIRRLDSFLDFGDRLLRAHGKIADAAGMDIVAYEGGQHISAAIWGPFAANLKDKQLVRFLNSLNNSPEMTSLYGHWFDLWQAEGGKLFAHFSDYGAPSNYGSFGLIDYLGQQHHDTKNLHRYRFVQQLNRQAPWWNEPRAPEAFLQGSHRAAPAGGGKLHGTRKTDWLIGSPAKDNITGGGGGDHINGAGGPDRIDAGNGNDIIVWSDTGSTIQGGNGRDVVRIAHAAGSFDAADLKLQSVEVLDLRNGAVTKATIAPKDAARIANGAPLTIFVETADRLSLPGFSAATGTGLGKRYVGNSGGQRVELTVATGSF